MFAESIEKWRVETLPVPPRRLATSSLLRHYKDKEITLKIKV
jgi:hypothetical protein